MNPIKDTTQIKANKARDLFKKGNIFEPSIDELTEYIQALLSATYKNGEDRDYAKTLKDVIAIKRSENLHQRTLELSEKLHKRTSKLTWIVITVASINAIIGGIHIWLLCNK